MHSVSKYIYIMEEINASSNPVLQSGSIYMKNYTVSTKPELLKLRIHYNRRWFDRWKRKNYKEI